jgi:predicted RNA binding protein YcfA (HicA-like mRNA interferase family)
MKLPRDISGRQLAKALRVFGYATTRQTASHMRLTTLEQGQHHLTIPDHPSLRIGTLSAILSAVAEHFGTTRENVAERLFG